MSSENPNPPGRKPEDRSEEAHSSGRSSERNNNDQVVAGQEVEDFFQRLPGNFRWPKPNAEAVAAAVEAIQRMSGTVAAENLAAAAVSANDSGDLGAACSGCGGSLPVGARFCVWCGIPNQPGSVDATASLRASAGQQHIHHHYHHFVDGRGTPSGAPATESEPAVARGRTPGSLGISTGGRAEVAARQVVPVKSSLKSSWAPYWASPWRARISSFAPSASSSTRPSGKFRTVPVTSNPPASVLTV